MDLSAVEVVAAAEAMICAVAVSVFVLYSTVVRALRRREQTRITDATRRVILWIMQEDDTEPPALALRPRALIRLVMDLAPSIEGRMLDRLAQLAEAAGVAATARRWCSSRRWQTRLRGARVLSAVGGGSDVMLGLFADRHPIVRVQAAEWAAQHPSPAGVLRLVRMLDDDVVYCRFAVRDALIRVGPDAVDALAQRLALVANPGLGSALAAAAAIADPRFYEPALALCGHGSPQIRSQALDLVVRLGGEAAGESCVRALADPEPGPRTAAAMGLGRLGLWSAAPALGGLLRDPVWDVRQQAALALRSVGAVGVLMLRRALDDEDRFASDIARQVLDLPAGPVLLEQQ